MKQIIIITSAVILLLAVAISVGVLLPNQLMKTIVLELPNGEGSIHGLVFKGKQKHPLDGTLRLCWLEQSGEAKCFQQTNIRVDSSVTIQWNPDSTPQSFEVSKSKKKLMEFTLGESSLVCIQGNQYLAKDQYKK